MFDSNWDWNPKPEPKCKHCKRKKGSHRATDAACPSGRGNFPQFFGKTFFEASKTRVKGVLK